MRWPQVRAKTREWGRHPWRTGLTRLLVNSTVDALVVIAAFYLATALRFYDATPTLFGVGLTLVGGHLVLVVAIFLLVTRLLRLDQQVWQYAHGSEVTSIFVAVSLASGVLLLTNLVLEKSGAERPIPISVVLIGGILTFIGFSLVRFRWRLRPAFTVRLADGERRRRRTLIYGAGELGQHLASRLHAARNSDPTYAVVGFIDDNRAKLGLVVEGTRVVGRGADLPDLVIRMEVELVILAFGNISGDRLREVLKSVEATDAQIRIVPNVLDVVSGSGSAPLTREVRVSDLLGRQPAPMDIAAGETILQERTVLVTGACGSVGSELCRQALGYGPRHLILLDNNESGLFDLEVELRPRADTCNLTSVVADITQRSRLERLLDEYRPDVVFHAAAYKHVPLMERFPDEAVRVNVLGTLNVLCSAIKCGIERFVLVSTDKAVEPRSIMGSTKRLAEHLVLDSARLPESLSRLARGASLPLCTAVRFGNVLGSRGSVVPTFTKQIEMGGPVTVTHPDMTRYFMDISEAAHLIIQAAALTDGNDLFMLDMGQRIRIDDLARRMIRMRGLRPDIDIPILYSGVRPGEKLHEELIYAGEDRLPTTHPSIHRVVGTVARTDWNILGKVDWLIQNLDRGDPNEIAATLRALVAEASDPDGARDAVKSY